MKKKNPLNPYVKSSNKLTGFAYPIRGEQETFFPGKLAKVNEMLKRIIWFPKQ